VRRPRSVRDADVAGKRVLVRVDFNVPLEDGRVADDTRIRAALPTIRLLLERDAENVRLCSHLGRPKGEDPAFSLRPVEEHLRSLVDDPRIVVLENTRFHPGETTNDPELARELADGSDLYVNDAFGSAHRAHASTEGVAHLLPAFAGLLLERELEELGALLEYPGRPFVAILGGAKVEDKIGVLESLSEQADAVLVGGKMAEEVSPRDKVMLPMDVVAAEAFEADAESQVVAADPRRGTRSRRRSRRPRRCSGTGRWACSSGRGSPRGRRWLRGPLRMRMRTRSSVEETRCVRSMSSDWRIESTGCRRAAEPRSSSSRARNCRASSPSRRPDLHTFGPVPCPTRPAFRNRLELEGGPRRPRREC
jgi:hypothetical protein